MSSGPDNAYKMECDSKEVRALQRKYMTGERRRVVEQMFNEAKVRLIAAKSTLEALDVKVKATEGRRAFHEETDNIEYLVLRIERAVQDMDWVGVDLKKTSNCKHHYATDDIDEGCTHCGLRRRP